MNEVMRAMLERRSIRSFTDEPVSREDLEQIIQAGLYAPNGMGKQETIILAVTDPALRKRLSAWNAEVVGREPKGDPFYGAPAVLIVLANKDHPTGLYDGSLVMGNMLLAAHTLGLGGIWIHRAKQEFETEEGKALLRSLGIEGEYEGIGHCAVGHIAAPAKEAAPRKEGRVYYI